MGSMKKIIVTGGGGFIGLALTRQLLQQGLQVTVVGRHRYPTAEDLGAVSVPGDIRDAGFLDHVFAGHDTVFHVAALAGIWGRREDFFSINVQGTRNIISSCRKNSISRLIYTSTPSVVFDGSDIEGGDETLPYASFPLCHYAASKIAAEKEILAADSSQLRTIAIRPHLVYGPGDNHLVPGLLQRARTGRLRIIGRGDNRVDVSFIDNVVQAHMLAAGHLEEHGRGCGQPFFIGDGEPVVLWSWINDLLGLCAIPLVKKRMPYTLTWQLGRMLEMMYNLFKISEEPPMTRFLAGQLGRSHWFSHERARDLLGYRPSVSTEEGVKRLVHWCRKQDVT